MIVKPLRQLPPSEAKCLQLVPRYISKTGNVARKLPKYPLLRDILGDLRATFLADLARKLFFDVNFLFGVCGSQGLYNGSRRWGVFKQIGGYLRKRLFSSLFWNSN